MPPDEFVACLVDVGARRYHDKHPFHALMNEGELTREQLRMWALNRFYYQRNIPPKDCALMARMPSPVDRRRWRQRLLDQDGTGPEDEGGIERWLRLVEAVGGTREEAWSGAELLPGVRFAVDAYVQFVSTRPWIEGVASSLTELFSPDLMTLRIAAFERHYPWVDADDLAYFRGRPSRARNDSDHALELVLAHCATKELQDRAIAALNFKCDLLWAQLDAIWWRCVKR